MSTGADWRLLSSCVAHVTRRRLYKTTKQICVQLPTSAVNVAPPAFAAVRRAVSDRLISPASRALSSKPAGANYGTDGHPTVA